MPTTTNAETPEGLSPDIFQLTDADITGILWATEADLSSFPWPFATFDYFLDGLLSQTLKERSQEGALPAFQSRHHFYMSNNFGHHFFLAHFGHVESLTELLPHMKTCIEMMSEQKAGIKKFLIVTSAQVKGQKGIEQELKKKLKSEDYQFQVVVGA